MEEKLEYDSEIAKKIIEKLKINLKKNNKFICKANDIDISNTKKIIKLEDLIEIIDKSSDYNFIKLDKNFIIYYKGDPYITINLFVQAVLTRSKIFIALDEFMVSTNEILCTVFKQTLYEFKISNLLNICKYEKKQILELKDKLHAELIGIGDTLMYQRLNEIGKFYPYYNIIMYCDSEDFSLLEESISIYTNENNYELEIVYEEDIEITINYINMIETSNLVILLTKNKETVEKFKKNINKKLFINDNPFLKKFYKMDKYLK